MAALSRVYWWREVEFVPEECRWAADCPFFSDPVGYSPELGTLFFERYCRREYQTCARYIGRTVMGLDAVPAEMLPTDFALLDALLREWKDSQRR